MKMKRFILFFLLFCSCYYSYSQRLSEKKKASETDTIKTIPHHYSIKIIITKSDTTTFHNKVYQVYTLKVFNDTTVPICIAFGVTGIAISENVIFAFCLDTFYSDTLHYVDLMVADDICGWDVEAHPVAPVVLYPNSYLNTKIAIKAMTDKKRICLTIPYQDKGINFEMIAEYNQGKRRYLHIPYNQLNYKEILLPID
jgi:hypothetical protein